MTETNLSGAPRAAGGFDTDELARVWVRLAECDRAALAKARETYRVDFPPAPEGVTEDDNFYYLPVTVVVRSGDEFVQQTVMFALGDAVLVTLEPTGRFAAFERAVTRCRRNPEFRANARAVMRTLLQVMNEASNQAIELASASLEAMNDQIGMITEGVDEKGREIGVSDISDTMVELNEKEELVSRCQESQLLLARAARYLRMDIGSDPELRASVDMLLSDIDGVKQHASYEHEKVRYLQQSVMTSLNVKQNQIVKVFTIITAVFLPPTLVATFYGMNFAVMPELAWEHGFTATIIQTLLAALLPLIYIKRKGWLR
jgi:magnesium transporter